MATELILSGTLSRYSRLRFEGNCPNSSIIHVENSEDICTETLLGSVILTHQGQREHISIFLWLAPEAFIH